MELIYHGCMTKNADGTNKIIGPGEKCLTPTAQCFWKDHQDIKSSGVKTHNQAARQPTVSTQDYNYYYYNTVYYYSYSFNLLLVDFYFLLAQSQYNLLNRHVLGSATSKFSHFTVSFSFEGEILEKINSIETEDLSKANSVL